MRNILILLMFSSFNELISQEIIGMKEVYIENNLIYKYSTNKPFTGIAQHKRKNGHLVYEEEYKNGIILSSNLYFTLYPQLIYNNTLIKHCV